MKRALALLLVFTVTDAFAGGSSFECTIERFAETGAGQYVLTVRPLQQLNIKLPRTKAGLLVFHIEHSQRSELPSGNEPVSREAFLAAVEALKVASQGTAKTRFGYMGSAYRYIDGQKGHYRVFGLRIDEELTDDHKGTQRTVYAY